MAKQLTSGWKEAWLEIRSLRYAILGKASVFAPYPWVWLLRIPISQAITIPNSGQLLIVRGCWVWAVSKLISSLHGNRSGHMAATAFFGHTNFNSWRLYWTKSSVNAWYSIFETIIKVYHQIIKTWQWNFATSYRWFSKLWNSIYEGFPVPQFITGGNMSQGLQTHCWTTPIAHIDIDRWYTIRYVCVYIYMHVYICVCLYKYLYIYICIIYM